MTLHLLTIPALLALATAATASSGQTQARQPKQQAAKPMSKADFTKNIDARFAAMDANKDGQVDRAEIAAMQDQALKRMAAVQQQRLEAEFRKLDTNKDGSLTVAEFKAAAPAMRPSQSPDQMLSSLDTNKDGKILPQEVRAPALANFDKLDSNRDGMLSPQEAQPARRR